MRGALLVFAIVGSLGVGAFAADTGGATTQPTIPALEIGPGNPPKFVAEGIILGGQDGALAFHLASDGHQHLCALLDATDRTPIFISDGNQSLIYDLSQSRIVLAPGIYGHVGLDWDATAEDPAKIVIGVDDLSNLNGGPGIKSSLRVDRWVAASAKTLQDAGHNGNIHFFHAERKGALEILEMNPSDPSWFRFVSRSFGKSYYSVDMRVSLIGEHVPAQLTKFPDVAALKREIAVAELGDAALQDFMTSGNVVVPKMALAEGKQMQDGVDDVLHHPDWKQLRARDKDFGEKYRAALEHQGIRFYFQEWKPSTPTK